MIVLGSASAAFAESYDLNPKDRWPNPVMTATQPAPHGAMLWAESRARPKKSATRPRLAHRRQAAS